MSSLPCPFITTETIEPQGECFSKENQQLAREYWQSRSENELRPFSDSTRERTHSYLSAYPRLKPIFKSLNLNALRVDSKQPQNTGCLDIDHNY